MIIPILATFMYSSIGMASGDNAERSNRPSQQQENIRQEAGDPESGFSSEWMNTNQERVARRQLEVRQVAGNRSTPEYRTQTTNNSQGNRQQQEMMEDEERMFY